MELFKDLASISNNSFSLLFFPRFRNIFEKPQLLSVPFSYIISFKSDYFTEILTCLTKPHPKASCICSSFFRTQNRSNKSDHTCNRRRVPYCHLSAIRRMRWTDYLVKIPALRIDATRPPEIRHVFLYEKAWKSCIRGNYHSVQLWTTSSWLIEARFSTKDTRLIYESFPRYFNRRDKVSKVYNNGICTSFERSDGYNRQPSPQVADTAWR